MTHIRRLFCLILIIISISMFANAGDNKNYKCEGTTYSSTGRVNNSSAPISTGFTWQDSKGKTYPIYMSDKGSCYIIRTSKNTGKDYKSYLCPEISQDICKKMNREYKSKKK